MLKMSPLESVGMLVCEARREMADMFTGCEEGVLRVLP